MNIQELRAKLETLTQLEAIGINVFFIMKSQDESFILKKADIRRDAADDLIESVLQSITTLIQDIDGNDDLQIINLSAADDRASAIYQYDLDDIPLTLSFFREISDHRDAEYFSIENERVFSFLTDDLKNIDGYIIRIGSEDNNLMIYRKNYPVNIFKRDKIFLVLGDETQFSTLQNDFLRIDSKIDFLYLDQTIFIKNIQVLEKFCDFTQIITTRATTSLNEVQNLSLVENIEVLRERINELSFARKLTKISNNSPVFTLPKSTILSFAQNHRLLANAFKYSENGNIILDTKKSQNLFVRLLNDDFLHSELTNTDYMTPAKDKLE